MSLILDALNRADRERKNSQPTPDINTVHEVTYRPERAKLPRLWVMGGVVLLISVLILLVYLLMQARHETPQVRAAAPVTAAVDSVPPSGETRATEIAAQRTDPAQETESPNPIGSDSETKQLDSKPAPGPEVHSLYAETPAPQVDDKVNDLYKPVEEPPVVESVPVQVPEVTSVSLLDKTTDSAPTPAPTSIPTGSPRSYDAIHNVQDLRQLPWSLQQEIPSIIYSQHNFTGDGASNVVLNGQPRRVGNQVGGQLSLEEIYVDGILLRFREHRFKLRALNNWVNM